MAYSIIILLEKLLFFSFDNLSTTQKVMIKNKEMYNKQKWTTCEKTKTFQHKFNTNVISCKTELLKVLSIQLVFAACNTLLMCSSLKKTKSTEQLDDNDNSQVINIFNAV